MHAGSRADACDGLTRCQKIIEIVTKTQIRRQRQSLVHWFGDTAACAQETFDAAVAVTRAGDQRTGSQTGLGGEPEPFLCM